MTEIIFLSIVFAAGLFAGFGMGMKYFVFDYYIYENPIHNPILSKIYDNKIVSIITAVLMFPFLFLICLGLIGLGIIFCPDAMTSLLLSDSFIDISARSIFALIMGEILSYICGGIYNEQYKQKKK